MSRYPRSYTAVDVTATDDITATDDVTAADGVFSGTVTAATVTASVGVQSTATARTATADGTGTGQIAAGTRFVTVTSANADHIITLPAPVIGYEVTLRNAGTGYELRTSDPATIGINGGTGAGAESAIGANVTTVCRCVTATAYVCTNFAAAGTVSATEVAA